MEFRIFRGTLKRNTLLASLELVDKICHLALYLSDEEMQGLAWTTFVSSLREQDCPELVQYLKERRLYLPLPFTRSEMRVSYERPDVVAGLPSKYLLPKSLSFTSDGLHLAS